MCVVLLHQNDWQWSSLEGSYLYFAPSFDLQPSSMESLQEPRLVICRLHDRNEASVTSSYQFLLPLPNVKLADSSAYSAVTKPVAGLHHVRCANVLNLVMRLPWENFEILIFCVGASRSFPFPPPLHYHYALLVWAIGTSVVPRNWAMKGCIWSKMEATPT